MSPRSLSFVEWLDTTLADISADVQHPNISMSAQGSFFDIGDRSLRSADENLSADQLKEKLRHSGLASQFKKTVQSCLYHSSEEKFACLYNFCKDFLADPKVIHNPLNPHLNKILQMNKQVGRDIHKMRAFVRFKERQYDQLTLYSAFYESDHYTLLPNAPFFKDRFSTMNWIITTPYAQMGWNGKKTLYQVGNFKKPTATDDPFEGLWKSYFASTFNPGRLKIKAMKNEMPTRFWKNLPEADLIPEMIRTASARVEVMKENSLKNRPSAKAFISDSATLEELRRQLPECKACSLCELPSRPLLSTGSADARLMIVGEAPGDQEERQGVAFCGPAGQVLRGILNRLQVPTEKVYFSNAVKHFGYTQRGKQRIHKSPSGKQVMSCRDWLQREIEIVKPTVIIGCGRSAIHSLLGFPMDVSAARKGCHAIPGCDKVYFTFHPSAVLREKNTAPEKQILSMMENDFQHILDSCLATVEDQ